MRLFKELFGRIWAFWGLLSFVVTFLIIFLPSMLTYLFPEPKSTMLLIKIAKAWMRFWLLLVGCPLKIKGRENFAAHTSYIVTCNHNSLLDIPLSSPFIPGPNKTIAKKSFVKVPLFGWFYRQGSVLVDRKSDASRRKSFEEMKQVLKKRMHMCIYPEGTRNRTTEPLKKFYDGAFRLATETNTAIIPSVILHTKEALPVHKPFYFIPKKLEIHFLDPISPDGHTTETLKEYVFNVMKEYYKKNTA